MIYPSNFEEKIGFTQLRRYLSEKCISPLGVRKCEAMSFLTNFEKVKCRLLQTNEMLQILRNDNELPIDNLHDMTQCLLSIRAEGSFMTSENLYKLKQSLETIRRVHHFFTIKDDDNYVYPYLAEMFRPMMVFPEIISLIDGILNKFGEVKDTASENLADIRRSIL